MSAAPPRWMSGYVLLLVAAICAAAGQILFKLGAANRTSLIDFVNPQIIGGGAFYFIGTLLWVAALSKTPLSMAYPFTALTFVFVYLASIALLGERSTLNGFVGVGMVLAGLAVMLWSR
jgi:undecaprenyl phosphate-alpha-L-ara4N flippase subunit ArnE